ncbi:MAG: hypothetical protein ACYDHB_09400 [Candidatus Dormibacteria bacterium]
MRALEATAYVDESIRMEPPLYVLAAVLVAPTDEIAARQAMAAFSLPHRAPRFHWHDERENRRLAMLRCLADLRLPIHAYVRPGPVHGQHAGRARSRCLTSLLQDLRLRSVGRLVIESREPHNDRRDARTILGAQQGRLAASSLEFQFARPREEPLLWPADAVAGAVASSRADTGPHPYLELLQDILREITVS